MEEKKSKSRSFFVNTSALFILQLANYVLPFILIPYLTRVLGASVFGIIAYGLSIAQIACIITDYGFNLSVTYRISKDRENKYLINKLIGAVTYSKFFLFAIVSLLLSVYLVSEEKYDEYEDFLWLILFSIIGQTFQPIWFFQGIEKMIYITLYTVASRLVYLVLVIVLVKSPNDYYLVALANGFAHITAAIIGNFMIWKLGYKAVWPGFQFIKEIFNDSTQFFWSRAALATYSSCGAFFLGVVSNPLQVAYYSAAEQLYRGGRAMFEPISQSLYPHMAAHRNFKLFFKVLKFCVLGSFGGIIFGVFSGHWFINLLFGSQFQESYNLLIVFLFIFTVSVPSILLGYPFLGALGHIKLANNSVIYAGIVQTFLLFVCYVMDWNLAIHVVSTIFLVELIVLAFRINWAKRFYKEQDL